MMAENYGKRLLAFVDSLNVPYFYEPSFKLMAGSLLSDRFLLILYLPALKGGEQQLIHRLALQMNMPNDFRDAISEQVVGLREVIVGFDGRDKGSICKFYVEEPIHFVGTESQKIFTAYKWQPESVNTRTVDSYYLAAVTSRADILDGIRRLSNGRETQGFYAASELLFLASKLTLDELFYMEVEDQTQTRSSFDIRFYDAELDLQQAMPVVYDLANYFDISIAAIDKLLAAEKNKKLGHLSSGIGRDGKEFVTFYYGVQAG